MKISLSQKLYQPINQNNYTKNKTNPSFKAISPQSMILTVNLANMMKKVKELDRLKYRIAANLKTPKIKTNIFNSSSPLDATVELASLNSKSDKNIMHKLFSTKRNLPSISEIKQLALTELLPKLNDNNGFHRAAKTGLLNSMYQSGEYTSNDYIMTFDALPDNYYKPFKEELANKALYTASNSKNPERFIYNLYLIQAIDKPIYEDFFKNNKDGINNLKATIYNEAYKQLTDKKNSAYQFYTQDFKEKYSNDMDKWSVFMEQVFYSKIVQCDADTKKMAEVLNTDEPLLLDIINDHTALSEAKNHDIEKKLMIHKQRIKEKFAAPFNITKSSTLTNLECKEDNINLYMQKSGYEQWLKQEFKQELSKLRAKINEIKYCSTTEDDGPDWRWCHGFD